MSWGALAALGGAALNASSQHKAKSAQAALLSKIKDLFRNQQLETDVLYGGAQQQILKGMMESNKGYAQARKDVSMSGSGSRQQIMDMMKQNIAQLQQNAISGGFGNSSVLLNMQRGAYADTQKNLLGLDSNIAGQLGGMSVDQGQMNAALYGQIAQILMAQANAKAGMTKSHSNLLSGVQHKGGSGGGFGGLDKIFSSLGGMFGGGGGSSGGSSFGGWGGQS